MQKLSDSVNRKFVDSVALTDWEIETPSGFVDAEILYKTIPYPEFLVETIDGKSLKCAADHILIKPDGSEVFVETLVVGEMVQTRDGDEIVSNIEATNETINMYDVMVNHPDHVYFTDDFVSHNTTSSMAYLLHYILTNKNVTVAVLANKGEAAQEVLDRIKFAYEELPYYMQVGVKVWNKKRIELANGSKIISAATSGSSIRSKSINCVTGDIFGIFLTKTGVENINMFDLVKLHMYEFKRVDDGAYQTFYPNKKKLKVLTQQGMKDFEGVAVGRYDGEIYRVTTKRREITVTDEHKFMLNDTDFVLANELTVGTEVVTLDGLEPVIKIEKTDPLRETKKRGVAVFDLINVADGATWFTNGILSHNCLYIDEFAHIENDVEFYTSTYPVISSGANTQVIITSTPKGLNLFYKLWTDAEEGRNAFKTVAYDWRSVPNRDQTWYEETLANTSPQQFAQEYECVFGDTEVCVDVKGLIKNMTIEKLYMIL